MKSYFMNVIKNGVAGSSLVLERKIHHLDRYSWRLFLSAFVDEAMMESDGADPEDEWECLIYSEDMSFVKVIKLVTRIVEYPETAGYIDLIMGGSVVATFNWFC